jgi:hypothetical protein
MQKTACSLPQNQGYHSNNGPAYPRARATGPARYLEPAQIRIPRCLMGSMLILWIVWAGVLAILLILLAYRGTITRYEEDQIFLDDCAEHQKKEQTEILAKVSKIQPFVRIATGATCVLTACIIGIYVWDAVHQMM